MDTDVLSETARAEPHPGALAWMSALDPLEGYLSILTLGEIGNGLSLMPPVPRERAFRS